MVSNKMYMASVVADLLLHRRQDSEWSLSLSAVFRDIPASELVFLNVFFSYAQLRGGDVWAHARKSLVTSAHIFSSMRACDI